jgi:hypothetical protein
MTGANMSDVWKLETLRSGDLELTILPGIGGRLWDIKFQGRSLLFQNQELQGHIPDLKNLQELPTQSPHFGFPLWGGEKTWIAPDTNWTKGAPYPSLDSGPYRTTEMSAGHVTLRSEVCPHSGLQVEREIRLVDGLSFTIQHKTINRGPYIRDVGIWSVMMLNHRARFGIPGRDLRIHGVFGDPEGFWTSSDQGLICDCSYQGEFKVGLGNPNSSILLCLGDDDEATWMRCESSRPKAEDLFAHGYPLEVFNSGDYAYCEAEWHGPLQSLPPEDTTEFTQRFDVWTTEIPVTLRETELELRRCMS